MSIQIKQSSKHCYLLYCDKAIRSPLNRLANRDIIPTVEAGKKTLTYANLQEDLFDPQWLVGNQLLSHTGSGRGQVYFYRYKGVDLVLRFYLRGGLVAKLNRDKFYWLGMENSRVYQELSLLELMDDNGLPVPSPVAGLVKLIGPFYQAAIITRHIPNTEELHQRLQREALSDALWHGIGKTIKRMHSLNVYHPDINVKNLLIDNTEQIFLIDFDKCQIQDDGQWKQQNLIRFKRSLDKQAARYPTYHFSQHNWQVLLQGYRG